ncbi:hypothetical protein U1E44_13925 [Arenibacter sp. GZD96]|uniref:hypothetical protein n=1 Tax=Aurantibrevibacter litoralis TaxID=3106030 RepID=UPI002B003465|nr:hypothetical protein [Arenibacter sp. GZD-96]MEA1787195.1 hypothetical protein [Arenibacter sp. GZD-96]
MAIEKLEIIKEADLSNNCPECFNQELKLRFFQKHRLGLFMHRTSNEVTHEMKCKKCLTTIYPSDWTADIERVFDYYEKTVVPEKSKVQFTKLFFALLLILIAVIAALGYAFILNLIPN